ncbi:MAG: cytochrome P450 [Chloroflexales bacterium]|nr:cytochrome P450 [Chloroflexales bacterium]
MTEQASLPELFTPDFKADPYPVYANLRETSPIHRVTPPEGRSFWVISRYADVDAVLRDNRFSKNWRSVMTPEQLAQMPEVSPAFETLSHNMLSLDPPDHTRLRMLVSKAFTPRVIEQLRPRIQSIADDLLDAVQDKGTMDLIDGYAFPLPITVITDMLGVPIADQDKFRVWSNTIVSGSGAWGSGPTEEQIAAAQAFIDYLRAFFAEKRANPGDDLTSALIQAEEAGDTLSEEELYAMIFLLLIAGHETTVNLIGNGMLALLQHPDQMALLRSNPGLIKPAIEELLRYEPPVETSTGRFASEDIEIGGTLISKGEIVMVAIAAANRDPEQFTNPDMLDITRTPNPNLSFGKGIHYCLGAPLARLEGEIAINTLLRRMPNLRLNIAPEEVARRPGILLRGLTRLPVAF